MCRGQAVGQLQTYRDGDGGPSNRLRCCSLGLRKVDCFAAQAYRQVSQYLRSSSSRTIKPSNGVRPLYLTDCVRTKEEEQVADRSLS